MKSRYEMYELFSLIAHDENAEAKNKDEIEGIAYELADGKWSRPPKIKNYAILACDCADQYWEKFTAAKIEDPENLAEFIKITEEWMKLIQLADYFVGNQRSQLVSLNQSHLLIDKLIEAVKACKHVAFKTAKEKNINLISLNKILMIASHYLLENSTKWVIFACQLSENYRHLYERFSKSSIDLNEAAKYAKAVVVINESKKVEIKYLISVCGTLGRIYLQKWQDNREIKSLHQAINFFEKSVISKQESQKLYVDDNDLHMLISLSLTMAEDGKQSLKDKLRHYNKALGYADLISDNRKLCHLYTSLAEYYENNYYVEDGKEFVIVNSNEIEEKSAALKRLYWEAAINMKKYVQTHGLYTKKVPLAEIKEAKISELIVFIHYYNVVCNNFKKSSQFNKHLEKSSYWSKKHKIDTQLQEDSAIHKRFRR